MASSVAAILGHVMFNSGTWIYSTPWLQLLPQLVSPKFHSNPVTDDFMNPFQLT